MRRSSRSAGIRGWDPDYDGMRMIRVAAIDDRRGGRPDLAAVSPDLAAVSPGGLLPRRPRA